MIYYVYRSLSKQKTGKGKISFATFQHFNIFASGSGPFFNYYMVPFQIIIYKLLFCSPSIKSKVYILIIIFLSLSIDTLVPKAVQI